MMFTADWIGLAVSSLFAYVVFGKISSRVGYPRWHGLLMAVPVVNLIALIANYVILRARSTILGF